MTDNLKQKTTNSFLWNAFDKLGVQTLFLTIGIITARLLSPKDFGLVGALAIFTVLGSILIDSGFSTAMIRRNNNTDAEYAAIFYFNLFVSVILYIILFFAAPLIASFFNMPELCALSRLLFLSLITNNLGIVQHIILTKKLAFKTLTTASIVSLFLSGVITVILIYLDFGYWSLAWQQVIQFGTRTLLLWILSPWRLTKQVNFRIIRELFSFSVFLLLNSVFSTTVRYVYNVIIGRLYTVQDLGYYSQANKYQQIPSSVISETLSKVAYPVLSKLNNNPPRQLIYFRKIMRIAAFAIFPTITILCLLAEPLFSIVLTDKWLPAVPYFQILSISGIVVTFHALNTMLMITKGFSKQMFLLEILRSILVILSVFVCFGNIKSMLYGFLGASIVSYLTGLFFIRKIVKYTVIEQLKDILPYGIISLAMGAIIYYIPELNCQLHWDVIVRIISGGLFYFTILYLSGSKVMRDMLNIFRK